MRCSRDLYMMNVTDLKASVLSLKQTYNALYLTTPKPLLSRVIDANGNKTLTAILDVLEADSAECVANLETLLRNHWQVIKGTSLAYTALPKQDITRLLCDVARFVIENKPPLVETESTTDEDRAAYTLLGVLMPGISLDSMDGSMDAHDHRKYPDLSTVDDLAFVLQTHVLDKSCHALLPVRLLTGIGTDTTSSSLMNVYYDYHVPAMNTQLDSEEKERLVHHSSLTETVWETKTHYELLSNETSNFLGYLRQLCAQLSFNSVSGIGKEENAGLGAYGAILAFNDYYKKLVSCDLVLVDEKPSVDSITRLLGPTMAGYLCYGEELYYANKSSKICELLSVTADELAQIKVLIGGQPRLHLTENNECALMMLNAPPSLSSLGEFNAAYLCYKGEVYYANRRLGICQCLDLSSEQKSALTALTSGMKPLKIDRLIAETPAYMLTKKALSDIQNITGHIHHALWCVETCSHRVHDDGIPPPVKAEIEQLLEFSSNPGANINATETLATCLATRRRALEQVIASQEIILSNLTLDGETNASFLEAAKQAFQAAKEDLERAMVDHSYPVEGHDKLGLTVSLLTELNVTFSITTPDDLETLKILSPLEISRFLDDDRIKSQLITQLATLELLITFSLGLSPERVHAIFSAIAENSFIWIKKAQDVSVLLQLLDLGQCQAVCNALETQLRELLNRGSSHTLSKILDNLSEEQCKIVLKTLLPSTIISAAVFDHYFENLSEPLQKIAFEVMEKNVSDLFRTLEDIWLLVENRLPEHRAIIVDAIKQKLPEFLQSLFDLNALLRRFKPSERGIVFESIQLKLIDLIQSSSDLKPSTLETMLEYLSDEQSKIVLKTSLPLLIKSVSDFKSVFDKLSIPQQKIAFEVIEKNFSDWVTTTDDIKQFLAYRLPEHRAVIVEAIKQKLPVLLQSCADLQRVLEYLTPSEKDIIFESIRPTMIGLIQSSSDLNILFQNLPMKQRGIIFEAIKDDILRLINNAEDAGRILEYLELDQGNFVLNKIEPQLPELVKTSVDVAYLIKGPISIVETLKVKGLLPPLTISDLTAFCFSLSFKKFESLLKIIDLRSLTMDATVYGMFGLLQFIRQTNDKKELFFAALKAQWPLIITTTNDLRIFNTSERLSIISSIKDQLVLLVANIESHRIHAHDKLLNDYVEQQRRFIEEAETPEALFALKQNLEATLVSVNSPEVRFVKREIEAHGRPGLFSHGHGKKARAIQEALCAIPPHARGTVMSNPEGNPVQDAIARRRKLRTIDSAKRDRLREGPYPMEADDTSTPGPANPRHR